MAEVNIYGLKNCDKCRAAYKAFEHAGTNVTFIDIRQTPLSAVQINRFLEAFGQSLVNTRSTTWRGLSDEDRGAAPAVLLSDHPALMKRPVIEGDALWLGWTADVRRAFGLEDA